jgi:hypothetical protein
MRSATGESSKKEPARPERGYRLIAVRDLAALWFLLRANELRFLDLQTYFACHEAAARRCVVPHGKTPRFTPAEIRALIGRAETRARASLARLEAAGVLSFSETAMSFVNGLRERLLSRAWFAASLDLHPNNRRLFPVPRRVLRLMAGGARRFLMATLLGHMLWGLYRGDGGPGQGGFRAIGRVKCSWIAEAFGVGL